MLSDVMRIYRTQDSARPQNPSGAGAGRVNAVEPTPRSPRDSEAFVVDLSPEARKFLESQKGQAHAHQPGLLSEADQQKVAELKKEDQKVRTHEQQHLAASGGFATSGPSFEFTTGPDGQPYAVGGHVNIDTSPVPGDPEATIQKAQAVQRAALAPADPSAEDQAVAAQAAQTEMKAHMELERPDTASPSATSR